MKIKVLFVVMLCLLILGLKTNVEQVGACGARKTYGSGVYTNLYGSGTCADNHTGSSCDISSGSCSGSAVARWTCDGRLNNCEGENSNEVWGTALNLGSPGCGKTVQIDVFPQRCRYAPGQWTPGCTETDYIAWYSGDCPSNPSTSISCNAVTPSVSPNPVPKGQNITFKITGDATTYWSDNYTANSVAKCGGLNVDASNNSWVTCVANASGTWERNWRHCEGDFNHCTASQCSSGSTSFTVNNPPSGSIYDTTAKINTNATLTATPIQGASTLTDAHIYVTKLSDTGTPGSPECKKSDGTQAPACSDTLDSNTPCTIGYWCKIKRQNNPTSSTAITAVTYKTSQAGTYKAMIAARDSAGGKCSGNPWTTYNPDYFGWVYCGASSNSNFYIYSPSTISSVKITNSGSGGTFGTSGRLSTDSGSDYFNPIIIEFTPNSGTYPQGLANKIRRYLLAFYDRSGLTTPYSNTPFFGTNNAYQQIAALLQADPKRGFIIDYREFLDWSGNVRASGGREYRLYNPIASSWDVIGDRYATTPPDGYTLASSGQDLYKIVPIWDSANNRYAARKWKVYFYPAFGSKTMYTAAYLSDDAEYGGDVSWQDFRSNITPSQ